MTGKEQTTLLNGKVKLIQTVDGLRASMDSVLLASALEVKPNDRVLDMGCGTGAVGLCALYRLRDRDFKLTGLDIQPQMIEIAKQNAALNNHDASAEYICGDIHDKSMFHAEAFDHIVMNPPYFEEGERLSSPDAAREIAFQSGFLENWMSSALYWVRQGGGVSLVHRADKLDKILCLADKKFGAIEIWPIYSKQTEPAIRVLVRMIRNRKSPLTIHSPIVLFDDNGAPSSQSINITRHGHSLI